MFNTYASSMGVHERINEYAARAGAFSARVSTQPSWVLKAAFFAGALVLTGIVLLLIIPAILVALVVLILLSFVNLIRRALRPRPMPEEGRRNVRVVGITRLEREDQPPTGA
jgi:hypothetical protein